MASTSNFRKHKLTGAIVLIGGLCLANVLTPTVVSGATTNVASISALQTAINNAASGDNIVLTDGTYTTNNTLNIATSNITVRSTTPGGVVFSGTSNPPLTFNGTPVTRDGSNIITISGSNVTFSGFQFKNSCQPDTIITVTGNNNTITECNWSGVTALRCIRLTGGTQFNTISYCNIEKKGDNGITSGQPNSIRDSFIQIDPDPAIIDYHKIQYTSFQNTCPTGTSGDFGNEPIRIGESTLSTYVSRTIVEYCYFNNTGLGDTEAISIKSRENVIRYCTFDNNPLAMLVVRNGDNCVAYGNFFINGSGGIRVKESDNTWCYNNYFSTGTATPVYLDYITVDSNGNPISKPNNANFLFNTFVDCAPVNLGGTGPANMTFANNIFKNSSGSILSNDNGSTTYLGNIYYGTLGLTITSGMTHINPQLVLNSGGYYSLSSTSPAINAASAGYPAIIDITNVNDDPSVLLDINRLARPATVTLKDVGCEEYTTGIVTSGPLELSDVGPSYLGGPGSVAAGPGVIVAETFPSDTRTTQNPPNSLDWFCTSAGTNVTVSSGTMTVSSPKARSMVAYFPTQTLNVGDSLTLSFNFSLTNPRNAAKCLRAGLLYSGGGARITIDGTNPSLNYTGYGSFINPVPPAANPAALLTRSGQYALMTSTSAWTTTVASGGPTQTLAAGTTYTGMLVIQRTGTNQVTLNTTYSGGSLSNYALSGTDTSALNTQFDTVALAVGSSGTTAADSIAYSNISIIKQALATVTLGNLAQTYDGTPKSATATTSPVISGTVNFTYNGSSIPPTNPGSYNVVGTINDLLYTGSAAGTLVIADSIANWRQTYFGTTVSSGTAADTADPDGDGLTNLQEYVFGTNPNTPNNNNLLTVGTSGSNTTLSFNAVQASGAGYSGLTRYYTVQTTTDLTSGSWNAVSDYTSISGATQTSNITGANQTVTITLPTSATKVFYRLQAWLQ